MSSRSSFNTGGEEKKKETSKKLLDNLEARRGKKSQSLKRKRNFISKLHHKLS